MHVPADDDDASLVERCRAGDASAWRVLVERYQRLVYTIVRRTGFDAATADDVFQDVFARLLQHLHRLHDPSRLRAWIVTTAKRAALQRLALAQREVVALPAPGEEGEALQPVDPAPLPDEVVDDLQQLDRLRSAFERLDERCRALLSALHVDDPPPYTTLAAHLGMPVGSVGPTRLRCLDKLRRLFA